MSTKLLYKSSETPDKSKWCHTGEHGSDVCERSIYELINKSMTYLFPERHSFAVTSQE